MEVKKGTKNIEERLLAVRAAIPRLAPKKYSDQIKYKYNKISDVYEHLGPAMVENGVALHIVGEKPVRFDGNSAIFWQTFETKTSSGYTRLLWIYESDITLEWVNVDEPTNRRAVTIHALGTNDGGPDKAKGSAWTYAMKYLMFEEFGIDQGEDDPDNRVEQQPEQRPQPKPVQRQPKQVTQPQQPLSIPGGPAEPTEEERAIYHEAVNECAAILQQIKDAETANAMMERFKAVKHAAGSDRLCNGAWMTHMKKLGLVWDGNARVYVKQEA